MFFFRRKREKPRKRRTFRRVMIGFVIGGAITSIVGKRVIRERRREHLGEEME